MNTINCFGFFFCPRRNDGSHCVTASSEARQKNLEARVCVVPPPRKTGGVSCGGGKGKKRTNVGSSPPSMTNMHRERERESAAPKMATFPACFPRGWPEGKGYSPDVGDGSLNEWKEWDPQSPGACCQGCLCICAEELLSSLHQLLDNVHVSLLCCTENFGRAKMDINLR